jgi:hypothetical protein
MLDPVQAKPAQPASKPPISSKRAFDKLLMEVIRLAASLRGISGKYTEALIEQSKGNANKQWWHQMAGSAVQLFGTGLGIAAAVKTSPDYFNMLSKTGDIFKGFCDANQSNYQFESQKSQQAITQSQTWANGLQDLVRNMEAAKQRLQQMEDNTNR